MSAGLPVLAGTKHQNTAPTYPATQATTTANASPLETKVRHVEIKMTAFQIYQLFKAHTKFIQTDGHRVFLSTLDRHVVSSFGIDPNDPSIVWVADPRQKKDQQRWRERLDQKNAKAKRYETNTCAMPSAGASASSISANTTNPFTSTFTLVSQAGASSFIANTTDPFTSTFTFAPQVDNKTAASTAKDEFVYRAPEPTLADLEAILKLSATAKINNCASAAGSAGAPVAD